MIKFVIVDMMNFDIHLCQTLRHVANILEMSTQTVKKKRDGAESNMFAHKQFIVKCNVEILKARS